MPNLQVKGMSCEHCRQAVTKAVQSVSGVKNVNVDLASGRVSWEETGPVDVELIKKAIDKLGFEAVA